MSYEEKYKQALERASEIYNSKFKPNDAVVLSEYLLLLFPELKESEGEMIRKDIISYLRNEKIVKRYISDIEFDKWIAWLEKQDKRKIVDADKVIAWLEKHIIEWKGQDLIKTFTPNSPAGKSYTVEQFKQDFGL